MFKNKYPNLVLDDFKEISFDDIGDSRIILNMWEKEDENLSDVIERSFNPWNNSFILSKTPWIFQDR